MYRYLTLRFLGFYIFCLFYTFAVNKYRILKESRMFYLLAYLILTNCPVSPDEEDQGAAELLLRTYSAGPVSPIFYDLKGRELATRFNPR